MVARLDPVANTVSATKPLGSSPTAVASDPRSVWFLTPATNTLKQIDPSTGRVVALVEVGSAASWACRWRGLGLGRERRARSLLQIDPRQAHVVRSIPVAQPLGQVVAGAGSVWVSVP